MVAAVRDANRNEPEIAFPIIPTQAGIQSLRKKADFGTQALMKRTLVPACAGPSR
jgi:hypothetical protein